MTREPIGAPSEERVAPLLTVHTVRLGELALRVVDRDGPGSVAAERNRGYTHPMTVGDSRRPGRWVLLCYRMPREPSTPRIAVWRKLKRLGVGQLVDGLVALPADARTREQLEWIAQEVAESGGEASVWLARPGNLDQEAQLAARMAEARTVEYRDVIAAAAKVGSASERDRRRTVDRLSAELRRIGRRDFFPTAERDLAQVAVQSLLSASASHEVIAG